MSKTGGRNAQEKLTCTGRRRDGGKDAKEAGGVGRTSDSRLREETALDRGEIFEILICARCGVKVGPNFLV